MLTIDITDAATADPMGHALNLCDALDGGLLEHGTYLEVIHGEYRNTHSVLIPTPPQAEV